MRFYTQQHQCYCGIDLHTKNMYVCIINQAGRILFHKDLPANPEALARTIQPYLPDIAISVECIFTWYWIADFCLRHHTVTRRFPNTISVIRRAGTLMSSAAWF